MSAVDDLFDDPKRDPDDFPEHGDDDEVVIERTATAEDFPPADFVESDGGEDEPDLFQPEIELGGES